MDAPNDDGCGKPSPDQQAGTGVQCLPHTVLQDVCSHLHLDSLMTLFCACKDFRAAAAQVLGARVHVVSLLQGRTPTHSDAYPAAHPRHLQHIQPLCSVNPTDRWSQQSAVQTFDRLCKGWSAGTPAWIATCQLGAQCLHSLLHNLHALVYLDLRGAFSWVEDMCCAHLGTNAPLTLQHLVLQHCDKITADGIQALCEGGALARLRSLVLRSCGQIGDGAPLARLQNLSYLDASWCTSLTTQGVVGVCPQLQIAYFKGCEFLSDSICSALPKAIAVDLSFTKVTGDGLQALAEGSIQLCQLALGIHNNNIFNSAAYSQASLQEFQRQRPDVTVQLCHV